MTDQERIDTAAQRYNAAAHAMQSGVAAENGRDQEPKHLRVGVNSALVDSSSLAKLLIDKGVITPVEYHEAIADGMEAEVRRYEERLSRAKGVKITLA